MIGFYTIFKLNLIKNSKKPHLSKKTTLVKKNYSSQKKKKNFIYQNEATLDKKNNFTIEITEKNNVEEETFVGGNEYLLSSLYELSNLINDIKKKTLSNINFKRSYNVI